MPAPQPERNQIMTTHDTLPPDAVDRCCWPARGKRAMRAAMTSDADDVLDDLFHGCALRAYLEIWAETGQFPPDCEATRQRAYRHYEAELARKPRKVEPEIS